MPTPDAAAILAHPRFDEARRALIDGYLGVYSGDPALNKLLAEGARHVIITFVVCLSAAQREDDPASWLTMARLQEAVAAHQVGSPGLVEAVVTRMIDRGLLTATPAPSDRRKRILAPTAALLAHDRELIVAQALPCAMVAPSPAITRATACDPAFQRASRAASIAAFGEAMAMLARHGEMLLFVTRDSGLLALYAMLASARGSPGGNVSALSFQGLADRFGVSRTHVRDLVADAEATGLLRAPDAGGAGILITARLQQATDRFIADALALFAACSEVALVQAAD